jgi:hypothetical protein
MLENQDPHSLVESVPKTFKSDRIIAMEALERQFQQRPVAEALIRAITKSSRGSIRLRSQAASRSKCNLYYDTFDFSAGSDYVRLFHVKQTVPNDYPVLFGVREIAFRYSDNARALALRDGYTLPQGERKLGTLFATMGCVLTFPTMSWVLYSYSYAILKLFGATYEELKEIQVYGDDVILPHGYGELYIAAMTRLGFVINSEKSFYRETDLFRETCGMETYLDQDITPMRIPRGSTTGWWYSLSPLQVATFITKCDERALYTTSELLASELVKYEGQSPSIYFRSGAKRKKAGQEVLPDHNWIAALKAIGVNTKSGTIRIDCSMLPEDYRLGLDLRLNSSQKHQVRVSSAAFGRNYRKAIFTMQCIQQQLRYPAVDDVDPETGESYRVAIRNHIQDMASSAVSISSIPNASALNFLLELEVSRPWNSFSTKLGREFDDFKERGI